MCTSDRGIREPATGICEPRALRAKFRDWSLHTETVLAAQEFDQRECEQNAAKEAGKEQVPDQVRLPVV